jgi:hypothetical protein
MMSSMITQTRPFTSPMTFITSAVPSSLRRLSMIASSASSRFAHARARRPRHRARRSSPRRNLARQPLDDHGRRKEMIDRNIEEA